MKWIILYLKNIRLASFELNEDNLHTLNKNLVISLIQKDIDGSEHYAICGYRK
jgi:hypothetical protein